jgi:hypothetical protein
MTNSGEQAVYESFMYKSLDYVQGMEMNRLHEHLLYKWDKEKWPGELTQLMWNSPWACKYSESHSVLWSSYSQEALMGLREYCEKFLLQIGNCLINTEGEDIKELGEVSLSDLKRVVNDPKLKCCVESLVRYWREIGLKANIVLMEIPGWKEAFEKAVTEKIIKLRDVQNWAEDLGLWKTFIEKFGKQRLENLYRICGLSQWFS